MARDITTLTDPLYIGNGANRTSFATDGTQRLEGTATAWRDMIMDISGRRLASTSGKVDYNYDEVAIDFASGGDIAVTNDRVCGNQEINHQFKVGTNITFKPHIHWWQQVTSNAVLPIVFTMQWRLQDNGAAKTTSWTTITADTGAGGDDIYDFTSESDGLYNQLTRFDDIVVTCSVSDTIQLRLARTDTETGDVSAYFLDLHGQVDSFGSDDEIAKA